MKKLAVVLVSLMVVACNTTTPKTNTSATDNKKEVTEAKKTGPDESGAGGVANNDVTPQSIYFDSDKAVIAPQYKSVIQKEAEAIKGHKSQVVTVEGNCDERGSDEYNLALGQRRADAVKKLLVASGVHAHQVKTASLGKEKPKATCHDESCWKENRRVDFVQG